MVLTVGYHQRQNVANVTGGFTLSHEEVTETTRSSMSRMRAVLTAFWEDLAHDPVD